MRVERAKMCRATWESLKAHIIRERKRKRDEIEADAEEARQRQRLEQLKKQHKSTLQETMAEIQQSETRLQELKEEKHEMFLKLKKVLNEDETRRRQQLLKDTAAQESQQQQQQQLQQQQQHLLQQQQQQQQLLQQQQQQQLNLSLQQPLSLHQQQPLSLTTGGQLASRPPPGAPLVPAVATSSAGAAGLRGSSPSSASSSSLSGGGAGGGGGGGGRLTLHKAPPSHVSGSLLPHNLNRSQQQQQHQQQQQQFHPMSGKRTRTPSPPVSSHLSHTALSAPYRHEYLYKGQPMPYMGFQSVGSVAAAMSHMATRADDKHTSSVYLPVNRGYSVTNHGSPDLSRDYTASHRVAAAPPPSQQQHPAAHHPSSSHSLPPPPLGHTASAQLQHSQGGTKPHPVGSLGGSLRGTAPLAPPQQPAPQAHAHNLSRSNVPRFYGNSDYH